MYKLVVSELAHEDLCNTIAYIKDTLHAPEAATRFADQVQQCYERLKGNPMIYALCTDERLEKEGYRKVLIKNYVLVFKVDNENKIVYIYRLFIGQKTFQIKSRLLYNEMVAHESFWAVFLCCHESDYGVLYTYAGATIKLQ